MLNNSRIVVEVRKGSVLCKSKLLLDNLVSGSLYKTWDAVTKKINWFWSASVKFNVE